MASPLLGIANRHFGWPIRTKVETRRSGIRWTFAVTDEYGNQLARGKGFVKQAQAWAAGMKFKREARRERIAADRLDHKIDNRKRVARERRNSDGV